MRSLLLLALALAGCSTPFVQPEVEVPGQFAQALPSEDEPEVAWWESYGDPVLSDLIRRAAGENRDIKIAAERVRAARAGVTISRSAMLPNVGPGSRASATTTGMARRASEAVSGRQVAFTAAWISPGRSIFRAACAPAPRQPPPTR